MALRKPDQPLVGEGVARRAADMADLAMAELVEVRDRALGRLQIVGDDRIDLRIGQFVVGGDQRQGRAFADDRVELAGVEEAVEQQQPVGAVGEEVV